MGVNVGVNIWFSEDYRAPPNLTPERFVGRMFQMLFHHPTSTCDYVSKPASLLCKMCIDMHLWLFLCRCALNLQGSPGNDSI